MAKIGRRQPDGTRGAAQEFLTGYRIDQRLVGDIGAQPCAIACIDGIESAAQGGVGNEGDIFLIFDME